MDWMAQFVPEMYSTPIFSKSNSTHVRLILVENQTNSQLEHYQII